MTSPRLSVIVCTYNRPKALRAVLDGLRHQSRADFEVIVADDGSGQATREVVDAAEKAFSVRLRHVWQEDRGFRLAAVRNRAAEVACAPFLVSLDGDCIPRRGFVDGHLGSARNDLISRGSRVLCDPECTRRIEEGSLVDPHALGDASLRDLHRRGRLNRWQPLRSGLVDGLRVLSSHFRPRNWRLLRGCNFLVPADAYRAVNGSDETFEGWGFEDSDLCIRLMNHGLRIRRAPASTCVLHLWHPENDRRFEGENLARLDATLRSGRTQPARGMQLPSDPA